jgi:hypothetical protein
MVVVAGATAAREPADPKSSVAGAATEQEATIVNCT